MMFSDGTAPRSLMVTLAVERTEARTVAYGPVDYWIHTATVELDVSGTAAEVTSVVLDAWTVCDSTDVTLFWNATGESFTGEWSGEVLALAEPPSWITPEVGRLKAAVALWPDAS